MPHQQPPGVSAQPAFCMCGLPSQADRLHTPQPDIGHPSVSICERTHHDITACSRDISLLCCYMLC